MALASSIIWLKMFRFGIFVDEHQRGVASLLEGDAAPGICPPLADSEATENWSGTTQG
jgi:hypothetical protein